MRHSTSPLLSVVSVLFHVDMLMLNVLTWFLLCPVSGITRTISSIGRQKVTSKAAYFSNLYQCKKISNANNFVLTNEIKCKHLFVNFN